jgi:hypothetical protein
MAIHWDGKTDYTGQTIYESFYVNNQVSSLKGCPKIIKGDFVCEHNHKLTSLKFGPEEVEGTFRLYSCDSIETLKFAPKKVEGSFELIECKKIKTLEGSPQYVGNILKIEECKSLTSLKGIPKTIFNKNIHRISSIENCYNLHIIDDLPYQFDWFNFNNLTLNDITDDAFKKLILNPGLLKNLNLIDCELSDQFNKKWNLIDKLRFSKINLANNIKLFLTSNYSFEKIAKVFKIFFQI